jgi:hypothetical protein
MAEHAAEQKAVFGIEIVLGDEDRMAVCTENLDSDVVVMKPAKDWLRFDASSALNRTGDWRIFIQ